MSYGKRTGLYPISLSSEMMFQSTTESWPYKLGPGSLLFQAQGGTPCGFSRLDCDTPSRRKPWQGDGPWRFPQVFIHFAVSLLRQSVLTISTGLIYVLILCVFKPLPHRQRWIDIFNTGFIYAYKSKIVTFYSTF